MHVTALLTPSLLLILLLQLGTVSGSRCYRCREVVFRKGDRKLFEEHERVLRNINWIIPCTETTYVDVPQATCRERVYTSDQFCFGRPDGKCLMVVKEKYAIVPSGQPLDDFAMEIFEPLKVKMDKQCQDYLCNGPSATTGLKCYHQCGRINLLGLSEEERQGYNLPVIPCDETTTNYCGADMVCGYIVGSAVYTDANLGKDITVVGWYADCFFTANNSIDHVLQFINVLMKEHPNLEISPDNLTKCDSDLCNHI